MTIPYYESDGEAHDRTHYVIFPDVDPCSPHYRKEFATKAEAQAFVAHCKAAMATAHLQLTPPAGEA